RKREIVPAARRGSSGRCHCRIRVRSLTTQPGRRSARNDWPALARKNRAWIAASSPGRQWANIRAMLHGFDRLLARRTLAFTALAFAIAIGVTISTDEAYSTLGMRVARLCAFAPALSAIGAAVTLAQSRARGELRALEALGALPFRIARGPMVACWALGLIAALVLASPLSDVSSLFPALAAPAHWVLDRGALFDPVSGVRVLKDGSFELGTAAPALAAAFAPSGFVALLVV